MKKTVFLISIALLLAACSQSEVEKRGAAMGERFAQAWQSDDGRAAAIAEFNRVRDSIADAGDKDDFSEAFANAVVTANDTIRLAANALSQSTDKFCDEYAPALIDALLDGKLNAEQANAHLNLVLSIATIMGRDELAKAFSKAVDDRAANLMIEKQMKVYAAASSPQALARALKVDKAKPDADARNIAAQIEALKGIYTPQQFKEFNDEYNKK